MLPEMTSQERIEAALAGKPVDHIPFSPFLAYVWEYFPAEIQQMGQLKFHQMIGADPLWRGAPMPVSVAQDGVESIVTERPGGHHQELITPVGSLHFTWRRTHDAGGTMFLVEHPCKTPEDLKTQLWIEQHTRFKAQPQVATNFLNDPGSNEGLSLAMMCFRGKTAFQAMVEHYVGTEELVYMMQDEPELVDELWQAMMVNDLECAQLAAESDYQYFLTFEDSGTQNYSPRQYAKYIAPEIRAYCDIAKSSGKKYVQHACGHLRYLIEQMVDGGVYAVESASPAPTGNIEIKEIRQVCGDKMGIIGGIEPVRFLNEPIGSFGSYVEQVIAEGAGGPFLLANSDSCPPGVTVDKFALAAEVARSIKG
ncbi:MAG: uroporphyrinogen decarboxylase family protein [Armatimonadota bacterium]